MLKTLSLFVCSLFIGTAAFAQQPGTANKGTVVNGVPAGNNYPFFCSLTTPNGTSTANFSPECGAALIAPQWVLTAGHCVLDFMNGLNVYDSLDVIVAPNIIASPGPNSVRVRSNYIAKHRLFDITSGDLSHDIALIHLRTPVNIQAIKLPAQGDNTLSMPGTTVKGMGYGVADTATLNGSDTLQIVDIKIIHSDTCNHPARYAGQVLPGMLCAGMLTGRATGNGAGDSGGPLFVEVGGVRTQVGIVSWGDGPYSDATHPGIYTRVSSYRFWIDSVMADYSQRTNVPGTKKLETKIIAQSNHLSLGFSMPLPSDAACALYDMTGKLIVQSAIKSQSTNFDMQLPGIVPGIYVLKLGLKTGETYQHKLSLQ